MRNQPILFSGSSNVKLAQAVCQELKIKIGNMDLNQFPDGETNVQILDDVRGRDVFVLQSIAGNPNHYLFELLIIVDAIKRSSAKSITAVIPYLGYCRQDRKTKPGVPITAKLLANLLTTAGVTNLITFDLHADQVEGFFETNVDHLHCQKIFYNTAKKIIGKDCIVVAPDIGAIKIAERMTKLLNTNTSLAVIKKERISPFEVTMTLIGAVDNQNVLIVDDLCSTASTLVEAAHLCRKQGAKKIIAAVTHGLFIDDAIKKIEASPLEYLLVTDTIEQSYSSSFIKNLSIAPMVAEAVKAYCHSH